MLVHDGRNPAQRARQASERRGAVPMQMQDIDPLFVDHAHERRQRQRIEPRSLQIPDVDAERLERFFGEIFLSQAQQGDVKTVGVESREHPTEETFDAVHPRSFPPKVIADLEHVQRTTGH